jgi:hypothetical protein
VALGELLTTRRHLVVPELPAPPPLPRIEGTVYSHRPQQVRRAFARVVSRRPVVATAAAAGAGFAIALGLGAAFGFSRRRSPAALVVGRLAALIPR